MAQEIDKLALSCNILLEKLFYLYDNQMLTRQQLLDNSKLKIKFLMDNLNNITAADTKSRSVKNLKQINAFLTSEEKSSLFFYSTPI